MAEVNQDMLKNMVEYGIEEEIAKKALVATGNRNVDSALEWYIIFL